MPVPDAERATIQSEKVSDYLLNLGHPMGRAKAIWFDTLDYTRDYWLELADDLLAVARKEKVSGTEARPNARKRRD